MATPFLVGVVEGIEKAFGFEAKTVAFAVTDNDSNVFVVKAEALELDFPVLEVDEIVVDFLKEIERAIAPAAEVEADQETIFICKVVAVPACELVASFDGVGAVLAVLIQMDAGIIANDIVLPVASEPCAGPGGFETEE